MKDQWEQLFKLAYNGKGMNLTLNNLPTAVVTWLIGWHNEEVEKEKEASRRS